MVELIFISSSRVKFSHLEYLLKDTNYFITPQRNYGIGYEEPRIYNREELLKASYLDARKRFQKSVVNHTGKFFVLEDTSVIIDVLSDEENEVPGLDIKYWMREHDFESVDNILKEKGNHRACTVRSDILLHLPQDLQEKYGRKYMVFTGYSKGYVCQEEKVLHVTPFYPWLDNKTFNKWFVPEAYREQDIPISALPISKADKYDFRKDAIEKMVAFLSVQDLSVHERKYIPADMPTLFDSPTFLLLGSTCAGKSTLAEYMSKEYGYYHIEASDFMHLEYYRRHGAGSSVAIGDFAEQALADNPKIVAAKVVEFCKDIDAPIVVSGFRTPIEVEAFKKAHRKHMHILFIDTDQNKRYERCLARNRDDVPLTLEKFQEKDTQQYSMGINVLERSIEERLQNNAGYDEYYEVFKQAYEKNIFSFHQSRKKLDSLRLEDLILLVLRGHEEKYFTTAEIAKLINSELKIDTPKSKNNVSRYFNQQFHPYYEIKREKGVNKYRINFTGRSQILYVLGSID